MATPLSRSNSATALNTGPPRTLLHQLLEEISRAGPSQTTRNDTVSQSPSSTRSWSSSQTHSPSVWVGGSSIARDARDKLRAADEARLRKVAANAIDGTRDSQTPALRIDTSTLQCQGARRSGLEKGATTMFPSSDLVGYQHDYTQHISQDDPQSVAAVVQGHDNTPFRLQESAFCNSVPRPLSPLIFSDVEFDYSFSSPQARSTTSQTEAPESATTIYAAEEPQTPTMGESTLLATFGSLHDEADTNTPRKRAHFRDDPTPGASPQKRRTVTLPDIRRGIYTQLAVEAPHCFIGVGGDNRCVLRDDTFTERAPTPRLLANLSTSDVLPELSSFRPTVEEPQKHPALETPPRAMTRAFTTPLEPTSTGGMDTPAWMRPMHLIDTNGKSIYMNVHDDGPIRHALCLFCFRTNGDFHKVHKHGCESCGRKEVLDSHYWEDDTWPDDSSDELASPSSERDDHEIT